MQTSLKLTLSLAILVLALATSPALAHKLLVSASPEEGGILTVTAFFPDGAPAQEVPVTAAPADGGAEVQGRTDARGVCRLAGLKPGTYRVAAGDPLGHRAETRVVIPGAAAPAATAAQSASPATPLPSPPGEPFPWANVLAGMGFIFGLAAFVMVWQLKRALHNKGLLGGGPGKV